MFSHRRPACSRTKVSIFLINPFQFLINTTMSKMYWFKGKLARLFTFQLKWSETLSASASAEAGNIGELGQAEGDTGMTVSDLKVFSLFCTRAFNVMHVANAQQATNQSRCVLMQSAGETPRLNMHCSEEVMTAFLGLTFDSANMQRPCMLTFAVCLSAQWRVMLTRAPCRISQTRGDSDLMRPAFNIKLLILIEPDLKLFSLVLQTSVQVMTLPWTTKIPMLAFFRFGVLL